MKNNIIEWVKGTKPAKLPSGTTITGVPIGDPVFNSIHIYFNRVESKQWWRDSIKTLARDFDIRKCTPLYYCQRCDQIEDGNHRYMAAKMNKITNLDLKVGNVCWARRKMLGGRCTSYPLFGKYIDKHVAEKHRVRERRWLDACNDIKWRQIRKYISLEKRSVLDVGCQVGFTCIESWLHGADCVEGWDIREDVLKVGRDVSNFLRIDKNVQLINKDWLYYLPSKEDYKKWDVVLCMGMLHYIPKEHYERCLGNLCKVCGDVLILELRINHNETSKKLITDDNNQTLPTHSWLENALLYNGYNIKKQVPYKEGRRGLWIMQRKDAHPMTADQYITQWEKNQTWTHLERPRHQERFRECAANITGEVFADVGCALGHSTEIMKGFHSGEWHGIDFSENAIEKGKILFPDIAFHFLKSIDDLCKLNITFDSVVCSEVLEHVLDDANLVSQIWKITKKNMFFTTPSTAVKDPGHVRIYNEEMLRALFIKYPAKIYNKGGFWYILCERSGNNGLN